LDAVRRPQDEKFGLFNEQFSGMVEHGKGVEIEVVRA